MLSVKLFILCVCYFVLEARCGKVPVTPCLLSDTPCILSSAEAVFEHFVRGIKEYNIPPIDPVHIKHVTADSGDLKLKFDDLTVVGLSKAKFVEIVRKTPKELKLVFETPITVTGTYDVSGKLATLDIYGHGATELKTGKARIYVDVTLSTFEKEGKTYYKVDGYKLNFDILDEFLFKFDNLFNGDKAKAEPVLAVIKQNSKDMISTLGGPVIDKIVGKCVRYINNFLSNYHSQELELAA